MSSPCVIVLSGEEEAVLAARARSVRSQYRDRLRAAIVLAAAAGASNAAIAVEMRVCPDTARKWRRRFAAEQRLGRASASPVPTTLCDRHRARMQGTSTATAAPGSLICGLRGSRVLPGAAGLAPPTEFRCSLPRRA